MSDFINTIDKYGDEETLRRILSHTLDELHDDTIKNIKSSAFRIDNTLTSVKLPNANQLGSEAFYGCTSLKDVSIPKVTVINAHTFYNTISLESINMESVTSINASAFMYAFSGSSNVDINIPECTSFNAQTFANSKITSIRAPKLSTVVNNEQFKNCEKLKTADLRSLKATSSGMFESCVSLEDVNLSSCETLENRSFGAGVFAQAISKMKTLALPKCIYIRDYALISLSNLQSLCIGTNNCNLTSSSDLPESTEYLIYVPHEAVSYYKSASNWSSVASKIYPICGEVSITNNNNIVTVTCDNPDAPLKYRINSGETQEYTAPFSINEGDVVYAYAERFGITDGRAFINLNANRIGGKIYYINPNVTGDYKFYREDGSEITGWSTVADLTEASFYKKLSDNTDKFYVYNPKYVSNVSWTYYKDGSFVYENVLSEDYSIAKQLGKGRTNTQQIISKDNGAYISNDTYTTIWYKLNELNNSNDINDWYVPTEDELQYLLNTVTNRDHELYWILKYNSQKCYTSLEGSEQDKQTCWVYNSRQFLRTVSKSDYSSNGHCIFIRSF